MTKAEIQLIRSLGDKKARSESGLFVAEGSKLVDELLASDFTVRKVYNKNLSRISFLKTPPDCLALVEIPRWNFDAPALKNRPPALKNRLVLALDEVQNPGNVGTIIRLADWFGITDILCSEGTADCFNPKVVQATMGALTRVRVHYGALSKMISAIAASMNVPVFGTFLDGENIYEANLSSGASPATSPDSSPATASAAGIVVLGSEGRGISAEIEGFVTRRLFIPGVPGRSAESLNVAVAAAIVVSEISRGCLKNM